MRPLLFVTYALMAVWLLIAGARRIAIELSAGADLDWAAFASGLIGGTALLLLLPALDDWATRRAREGR